MAEAAGRIRYLLPSGTPIDKTYTVPAASRRTIWVDDESFSTGGGAPQKLLADTDVSAVIDVTNDKPIIFHLADLWEPILRNLSYLDIRINAGGYIFISVVLFIMWVVTLMMFDRQIYMRFTLGQLKVVEEVGEGGRVYDSMGMTLEKHRGDFFRHMVLGLGSGDLTVRTSGAQAHQFEFRNVLFVGSKVAKIAELMREKEVDPSK